MTLYYSFIIPFTPIMVDINIHLISVFETFRIAITKVDEILRFPFKFSK